MSFSIGDNFYIDEVKFVIGFLQYRTESECVRKRHLSENEDPTWKMYMQTLMKRKKKYKGDHGQTIDEGCLSAQYYTIENELPVPKLGRQIKDPDWWSSIVKRYAGIDPEKSMNLLLRPLEDQMILFGV